jgi:hypothetical protein
MWCMAEKNPAAVALGILGASKGGLARARKMTPEARQDSARRAGKARMSRLTPEARIELARRASNARRKNTDRTQAESQRNG